MAGIPSGSYEPRRATGEGNEDGRVRRRPEPRPPHRRAPKGAPPAFSISLRPRPSHGELRATTNITVAIESKPDRGDDVERHHCKELATITEIYGKEGRNAEDHEHDRGERMEWVFETTANSADRPFAAEVPHIERHEGVIQQTGQN